MRILVTGGAGFIGSHFIYLLLSKYDNYQVVNFDKLTYAANLNNLKRVENHKNYTFIQGDITDETKVSQVITKYKIDKIINFAAESHVDRSIVDPPLFLKTNVLGTEVLLRNAIQNNVKKFVQISTDEVYGSLGKTGLFTEESKLQPNSPYSASKASADLLVRSFHKTYGLNVNITRCSNNYGPHQHFEKLIPLVIKNALTGEDIPVYGNGYNVRDWIYVEDHCRAVELVMQKGKSGEVYNIGSNNEWKNIDLIMYILKLLKRDSENICFIEDRLGHDLRYAIDSSKIKKELCWNFDSNFKENMLNTINWYKNEYFNKY